MRKNNDGSQDGVVSRSARSSFRALSNCIRVISSGASTVARTAASAASSAVNRDTDSPHDQVLWAGFDKLEKEDGHTRRVLLLAFRSGYQIWDVEDTENVHVIVSSHDGQASFLQMLPNPICSTALDDRFFASRPLLAVCGDSSWEDNSGKKSVSDTPGSETVVVVPTNVYIYSLTSRSYVRTLKFRSVIYTVRCSSRIVAVLQAAQIHCFDATTLEKDYTIVTNSIAYGSLGVGYGPLAVGPRWIAYSGSHIPNSSSTQFTTELFPLSSSPTLAQFARESSRQLASGIVNLGDKGYKSISRYCSEVMPNPYIPGLKGIGVVNENVPEADNIGMVIIKDIISKSLITQFKAHKSPISALCFDPSGMLLVTASTQGHNINVFRIIPRIGTSSDGNMASFVHMFRLQRGFTNAVIQDISFSFDSNLIVISSSRGTSHLFEIDPEGESNVNAPVPLPAINRIRSSGNVNGWIGTVSGAAAAAAAGMVGGSLPGAIASTFCYCVEKNKNNYYGSSSSSSASDNISKKNLLVFAPSGCMTQYGIKENPAGSAGHETGAMTGFDYESGLETEGKVAVVPIRRWLMIQNQSRREVQDQHSDIYGGGTPVDSKSKVFPEIVRKPSIEEPWKAVTKKGGKGRAEDKRQLYISEAELQMYPPPPLPLWARRKFRFQELVLTHGEVSSRSGGGGEMEIEGIQTRTIEARTRDLIPVVGYRGSPTSQHVMRESLQSPGTSTQGDQVDTGRGSESGLGVAQCEEESSRSEEEEESLRSEEEENQIKPVNKEDEEEEE
ncbi:unnamed protein product [Cochlearia groenlandica]